MKKIKKTIESIRSATGEKYRLKKTMTGGLQLISPSMISVVGGPYGMPPREFYGYLKSFYLGIMSGRGNI